MKIYIDGNYHEEKEAKISVFDHGLLYGDGVFEGIRVYRSKVFKLEEHISRLYASARAIMLCIPLTEEQLRDKVNETVQLNDLEEGYIRLLITRGKGPLGIDPFKCPQASVVIIAGTISMYPAEVYTQGIALITAATRRSDFDMLEPRIKSMNYLNNILAKIEARQAGCMEAVMLNKQGLVCECTGDNIFIFSGRILKTPSAVSGILEGITRRTILDLASAQGMQTNETLLTRYDLYNADECFITGTGAEIVPVIKIDGRTIGKGEPGEETRRLLSAFKELIG